MKKLPFRLLASLWLSAAILARMAAAEATVNWLDQTAPGGPTGVSFGVPWPRGAVQKGQALAVTTAAVRTALR